ncbi:MAG: hypothetical protein LAQ69_47960 [Acidobacteriia bacterium]|nr:hypothetical protein [Terriglobia bacterium]
MFTIVVDDVDLPRDERDFGARLEALGSDYEIQFYVRKAEWIPKAIEHTRVFIEDHQAAIGAIGGYVLKTVGDIFKTWAVERLKRAPANTEVLTIYGPKEEVLKKIAVKQNSVQEE